MAKSNQIVWGVVASGSLFVWTLLVAVSCFMVGRWSVPDVEPKTVYVQVPAQQVPVQYRQKKPAAYGSREAYDTISRAMTGQ